MVRVTQCTPRRMYGTCHSMHPEEYVWYVSLNAPRGGGSVVATWVIQSNLGYPNSFVLRILYCVRISEFVQITEIVAKISGEETCPRVYHLPTTAKWS